MNIRDVCAYANSQGIGMILYVNGRHMFDRFGRYTPDELFARFEEWGAAGVKPGFVTCRDQASEKRNLEMIEAAARHKLILTIHDEYVTTGIERTYPNCLTTEGILGDEGIAAADVPGDITKLFTRCIQGPTDHTFCYPGKATRGFALASSMMFRTGLNSLYWYGTPSSLAALRPEEKKFWADLPETWDDFVIPEAKMASYATYARKSGGDWYFGSISAVSRTMYVPLDFLDQGVEYVAEIYQDEIGVYAYSTPAAPIICARYLVSSQTSFTRPMDYGTGFAARIRPKTAQDTGLAWYSGEFERLSNLVGACEMLSGQMYTVATWTALETALDAAKTLLALPSPAPGQLNAAYDDLSAAKDGLRSVIVVIEQLDKIKCLPEAHYSPDSWAALQSARDFANSKLQSPTVTQAELDEAAELIKSAVAGLAMKWLEKDETKYLSDMQWLPQSYASYGNIQRDRSYENPQIELLMAGERTAFTKGLGTHAWADVYFDLENSDYEIFEAYVGVDALKASTGAGDVIFRVYSDDVLIYESAASSSIGNNAQHIYVPVANTKVLRLQADPNGSDNSDHADWADARLIKMREISPDSTISGISADNLPLIEFAGGRLDYDWPVEAGAPVPAVAVTAPSGVTFDIVPATKTPGVTKINVTRPNGANLTYTVSFRTADYTYLSDLNWDSTTNHGTPYGVAYKDRPFEGEQLLVAGPDGVNALNLPSVNGVLKGIGMQSDCSIIYNIEGEGYGRFETWIGASHIKNYNNSMIFKIFINDSDTPIYTSPAMSYQKPAIFVTLDLMGVRTIRLMLDKNGVDSGDHGNWANARFLKFNDIPDENLAAALDIVYLSDLDWNSVDTLGSPYGGVFKDRPYEGSRILVTSADSVNPMMLAPVKTVLKGLGMQSDCAVTYNIEGKGYGRFQAWVGASHLKNYPNSMIFKVFLDGATTPAYASPAMSYLKPAEFVDIDLNGVKSITLFLDKNGIDAGDHGNWADAKFVPPTKAVAKTTYLSDVGWDYLDNNGSANGGAQNDKPYEGNWVLVTAPDGVNALELPKANGIPKGIGMHAHCVLTYDIAGKGYDRFESWVGASHLKVYDNSMIFRVYLNDSVTPAYVSPIMKYLQPGEFVSINLAGVNRIRLELDMNGADFGDHGSWADAKFITYEDVSFASGNAPVFDIIPGAALSIHAKLSAGDGRPQSMIAALYNKSGRLVALSKREAVLADGLALYDLDIIIPDDIGDAAHIKFFIWDSRFVPLREPIGFPAL
jgi:hypothetical protein